ncbi:MAG: hypothetical protein ACR2QJ_12675 [Geminicoccaceae bacterium]
MTKKNRANHTPAFKAKVALAAIKGDATVAGGLDVFGGGFGLTLDEHQAEAGNVEADGDHVGGKRHVDDLVAPFAEGLLQPLFGFGHLVGGDSRGEFQGLADGAVGERMGVRVDAATVVTVSLETAG